MRVVLASNNPGKIKEFTNLLNHLNITLIPQANLDVKEIPETGITFVENALLKARHASQVTGLSAMADDSGLVVSALKGAPGIFSARYAGKNANATQNINKLIADLNATNTDNRQAFFFCCLVFITHAEDPTPLIAEGRWQGYLQNTPVGNQGFGYDPIFFVPSENKTAAELPLDVKNKISHRGIAMQKFLKLLPDKL